MRRFLILLVLATMGLISITAQTREAAGENRQKAVEALQRAQRAAGGLDRLQAIRDVTRKLEMVELGTGSRAAQTVQVICPRTILLTNHVEEYEIAAFFDGIGGWIKSPWGDDNIVPPWQRDAAEQELMRQWELLLQSDRDSRKTVAYVKSAKVGDKSADVLSVSTAAGGTVTISIDSATGDVLTLEYPRIGPRGPLATVTDYFSDYRKAANGLRVPFKIHTLSGGQPYMDTTVVSLEYNRGLRAEVLGRKEQIAKE